MTNRQYGYARVSTADQSLKMQTSLLKKEGIKRGDIFTDVMSTRAKVRPGLEALLDTVQPGDTIVIYKLDRIHRTTLDGLALFSELKERDVDCKCLTQEIDTSTPQGWLMVTIMLGVAQYERDVSRQRTIDGLARKKAEGYRVSRPPKITADMWADCLLWLGEGLSLYKIAPLINQKYGTNISPQAWYKHKRLLLASEPYPFIYKGEPGWEERQAA